MEIVTQEFVSQLIDDKKNGQFGKNAEIDQVISLEIDQAFLLQIDHPFSLQTDHPLAGR